jgi:signal transduction histidine kinase
MRAAVEVPVTEGADAAWWPFAVGAALALAAAAAIATRIAPSPAALRAAEVPVHSVAWLEPYDDDTPRHWLEGEAGGDLRHLPRDGRNTQLAILLPRRPDARGDTVLFLPAATGAPSVSVNNAALSAQPRVGEPYLASPRMRPVAISIPAHFFRPGANRLDAVFRGSVDPALMAPPLLGDEAWIAPLAARASAWTGAVRGVATCACIAAALLALGASAFAARGWFIGLAAAAAACACRLLPAGADASWLSSHASLVDRLLLAAALASLACAAAHRPRLRPGAARGIGAGALLAAVAAAMLVAAHGSLEWFSGAWLPWLEAFHGVNLAAAAAALAAAAAWTAGRGALRFARAHLDLSRAVRRQRIEIRQANRALELQRRRAAILEERQRLARDVHDGVGGTLASLLARIRMRHVDIGQIESELVGGLADLRLIVDSMDATGGSLATALAVFRARIAPQVEAAGMTLAWEQPEHPDGAAEDPSWMLHLYRLMQEAVNNALRHSRGRNLLVSVRPLDARRLRIEIADDGVGLPAQRAPHGNGLANMAWRAQRLGASLRFEPAAAAGGTRVVVELALPGGAQPRDGISPS